MSSTIINYKIRINTRFSVSTDQLWEDENIENLILIVDCRCQDVSILHILNYKIMEIGIKYMEYSQVDPRMGFDGRGFDGRGFGGREFDRREMREEFDRRMDFDRRHEFERREEFDRRNEFDGRFPFWWMSF